MADGDSDHDREDDSIPLNHLKPFGGGVKRKWINFIRASSPDADEESEARRREKGKAVANAYLATVMPHAQSASTTHNDPQSPHASISEYPICELCKQPIKPAKPGEPRHELSLVHQIAIPLSHPPSSIDRHRKGLAILSSQGWDPDARQGLGVQGEGRLFPVKAEKRDTNLGIGAKDLPIAAVKPKVQKLNAAQMKKKYYEDRARAKKLESLFYGNSEVNKRLGLED